MAFLCITLLQIADSKTYKVINKISVRKTSESFQFPAPTEPTRIKPISEKLGLEQSQEETYPELPKRLNREIINHKYVFMKDYEYESKPDNISFTWEPTIISPEENRNHGTTKLKGENMELDNSQLTPKTKYGPPKPISPTQPSLENDPTPSQEPPILVKPAVSVSYPRIEYGLPAPLPSIKLIDYNTTVSSMIPPYPTLPPTLSPQEEARTPLQTPTVLIPPAEPITFLPKLETMYGPPKAHKQYAPSFGSPTSFPPALLPLLPQVKDKTPFQDLLTLFQPGDPVSYHLRPKTDHMTPVLLPPLQQFHYKLSDPSTIVSYQPPLPTLSPQKDQSPPQILMILIPSAELVSEPPKDYGQQPPKPASFLLKPLSEYGLPKTFKEYSPLFSTQTSFPPLVQRPSPQQSQPIPAIDSVLFPPIFLDKNSPHNEFLFEPATQH